jgi:hypothetical protein
MKYLFISIFVFLSNISFAQASYPVYDSLPLSQDGLQMGYTILNTETKEVGSKGDFSRYQVSFFVTNITNQPRIIFYKQTSFFNNDIDSNFVRFDCLNATGARLTSKGALIAAKPCYTMAMVPDKCNTKNDLVKTRVQLGYFIKPGETISAKKILIVPLNEKPNVKVSILQTASAF